MNSVDYIPFINSTRDCQLAGQFYASAIAVRVSLECAPKTCPSLPPGPKKWLDGGVDALDEPDLQKLSSGYQDHFNRFPHAAQIADKQFQAKPAKAIVQTFVNAVLNDCAQYGPNWISVPQLPILDDSSRNKINRALAESTRIWHEAHQGSRELILPVILTNQKQMLKKAERNKKLTAAMNCLGAAGAAGVWMVDASLSDQDGTGTFDKRFAALRHLHEELNAQLPERTFTIGGPYWGMNVVLWARQLVSFAAIGLGNSYKYNIPGNPLKAANARIALAPLRRWAIASTKLKQWLATSAASLPPSDKATIEFQDLEKNFSKLLDQTNARTQTASFYKSWFEKFASLPPSGRALALYQDLSSAYVLGSTLPDLPDDEKTSRKPGRVAQQLMLNCL